MRAGNVNIKLIEMPHTLFTRDKNDLKIHLEISLKEALLGFYKYITHLDGRSVEIDRVGLITKPGLILRMKGEGMPVFG